MPIFLKKLFLSLLIGGSSLFVTAPTLLAQTQAPAKKPPREFSEKVSEKLADIRKFAEAKNYRGAINIVNTLLKTVEPETFDNAALNFIKGQLLATDLKYAESIPCFAITHELGSKYDFYPPKQLQDILMLMGQLSYQMAAEAKNPVSQRNHFNNALKYVRLWFENNKGNTPTQQACIFASSVLYQVAILDPKNIDKNLIKEALDYAWTALTINNQRNDTALQIILAGLYQLEEVESATTILELLIQSKPNNASYWQQLQGLYFLLSNRAREAKNEIAANRFALRAALTIERAQQNGFINTNRDNLNLVGIYYGMGEFAYAAQLIEKFIPENKLDFDKRLFDLLSSAYHQVNRDDLAIKALENAAKTFSDNGDLEFTISRLYYAENKFQEAYDHLQLAIKKGKLDKPAAVQLFLAFICFELEKYDETIKWCKESMKQPDAKIVDAQKLLRAASEVYADNIVETIEHGKPEDPIALRITLANTYIDLNRYPDAIRWLREAFDLAKADRKQPSTSAANIEKLVTGTITAGYTYYSEAIKKPDAERPGSLRLGLARVCFEQEKFDEAQKWLTEAETYRDAPRRELFSVRDAVKAAIEKQNAFKQTTPATPPPAAATPSKK